MSSSVNNDSEYGGSKYTNEVI